MQKRARTRLTLRPSGTYQGEMTGKTLTLTALALHIGVKKRTLYNMLKDGRFPVDPIPGLRPRRWNVEDVDRWRGVL
jgi:predicted DNA-binding transcriptional regulator AlpA